MEPGELVFNYCPRWKFGRYQKWGRLCTLGMVVQRINDVLCNVNESPRATPNIIHADQLRRYEGETPDHWKVATQSMSTADAGALPTGGQPYQQLLRNNLYYAHVLTITTRGAQWLILLN